MTEVAEGVRHRDARGRFAAIGGLAQGEEIRVGNVTVRRTDDQHGHARFAVARRARDGGRSIAYAIGVAQARRRALDTSAKDHHRDSLGGRRRFRNAAEVDAAEGTAAKPPGYRRVATMTGASLRALAELALRGDELVAEALVELDVREALFGGRRASPDVMRAVAARRQRVHGRFAPGTSLGDRLRSMFTPAEEASALRAHRQPAADLDTLYKHAQRLQPRFERLARHVGAELGAEHHTIQDPAAFERVKRAVSEGKAKTHVIVAALKGKDRAREKVEGKYEGDAGRLTDIVRGSVSVPSVEHIPRAVDAIRAHAERHGFQIVAPENRFSHVSGDRVHTGELPNGYRDVSMLLRHRSSGMLAEMQVHANPIWLAKEVGTAGQPAGHALYEAERRIVEKYGPHLPPAQLEEVKRLQRRSRASYSLALDRATRE